MVAGSRQRWYQVVHIEGSRIETIGQLTDVLPHYTTLTPFVSHLILDGARGEVLLIDELTQSVVARQDLEQVRRNRRRPTPG